MKMAIYKGGIESSRLADLTMKLGETYDCNLVA